MKKILNSQLIDTLKDQMAQYYSAKQQNKVWTPFKKIAIANKETREARLMIKSKRNLN
jgi:hypothetical protein